MTAVQGRIQTGSYKNKDGVTVYTTDVVADRVEFIDWGNSGKENTDDGKIASTSDMPEGFNLLDEGDEDDIPF